MVTLLFLVILGPLIVYVGTDDYRRRMLEYEQLVSDQVQTAQGQAGAAVLGYDRSNTAENELEVLRVIRRPEPLSIVVSGLDGSLPAYWDFTAAGVMAGPMPSYPSLLADLLGQLDVEFLVRVFLGLVAVLLAFDTVMGERESGAIKTLLSQPISRRAYIGGKLLGGAIAMLVVTVALCLVLIVSAATLGADVAASVSLLRLGGLCALAFAYLLSMYCLGFFVSSYARNSYGASVILLTAWPAIVLIIPSSSTLVARITSRVASSYTLEAHQRTAEEDLRRQMAEQLGLLYQDVTGEAEGTIDGLVVAAHRAELVEGSAQILARYNRERQAAVRDPARTNQRQRNRQRSIARLIMMCTPAGAFTAAVTDLAGTGSSLRTTWEGAVSERQETLDRLLFENPVVVPIHSINNDGNRAIATLQRRDPLSLEAIPAFLEPQQHTLLHSLPALAVLTLFSVAFIVGSIHTFARHEAL